MGEAEHKVLKDSIPEENAKTMIKDIKREVSKLFPNIELQVCCTWIHYFTLHFDSQVTLLAA